MIFSTSKCLQFDDVFTSGKYAGEKVCAVMAKDIGYLWWVQKNGTIFGPNVCRCLVGIKKDNKKWSKTKINKL
jgi:hypothetical protein